MGKSKKRRCALVNDWIKSIDEKCFAFDGETISCNSCKKEVRIYYILLFCYSIKIYIRSDIFSFLFLRLYVIGNRS